MVSIVLASHGDLAAGIKQTGSMVFGDQPSVAVVSLEPSMGPDDFRAKVEEAIASFEDQEQVLFLVDLWGGTPFNQISGLMPTLSRPSTCTRSKNFSLTRALIGAV